MDNQETLDHLLHWIWSSQLQIGRLAESTTKEWNLGEGHLLTMRQTFSQTSFDEHMVLIAGRNLLRAIDAAQTVFPQLQLPNDIREALCLLRNIYEHWDEHREAFRSGTLQRSGKEFMKTFPSGKPWSITYTPQGPIIGGVLPLNVFLQQLSELEKEVLSIEASLKKERLISRGAQ